MNQGSLYSLIDTGIAVENSRALTIEWGLSRVTPGKVSCGRSLGYATMLGPSLPTTRVASISWCGWRMLLTLSFVYLSICVCLFLFR